jgi:hypothetical protein
MSGLSWEDPPDAVKPGRPSRFLPMVEELRLNPGRWARLATYRVSVGSAPTRAKQLSRQFPDCEFVSRGGSVYGRAVVAV